MEADVYETVIIDEDGGTVAVQVKHETLQGGVATIDKVVGSAKCHPKDTFNQAQGLRLARARAYRRLANKLEEAFEAADSGRNYDPIGTSLGRTHSRNLHFGQPKVSWHWDGGS
jgi:hypothetical protein